MKTLLAFILLTSTAFAAGPYLGCDHQDGVDFYRIIFPSITIDSPVDANGDLRWDASTWTGARGWHDATVSACGEYAVEDGVTGNVTTAEQCSEPAPMRVKFPNNNSAGNFALKE